MSKKRLALVAFITIIVGLGLAFVFMSPNTSAPGSSSVTQTSHNSEITPVASQQPGSQVGKYVAYSSAAVQNDQGEKILFFHASWCPQCRQLDSEIKDNQLPAGTTIYKVDYDSNQSLRQKYGVTLQTTFVKIDENGNSVKKYVAYDEPTYEALKENVL